MLSRELLLTAEEAYLILAEANLADNNLNAAKQNLNDLLGIVGGRLVRSIDDSGETRGNQENAVDDEIRPNNSSVIVNGRAGLVLDRHQGMVNIPAVSGTSLTTADVDSMTLDDNALILLYRTRQEIFIGEGIRFVDMGIKFVINENEILQNDNINDGDPGTTPIIPAFIDTVKDELDEITFDRDNNIATTQLDLNTLLVTNKSSSLVLPFH